MNHTKLGAAGGVMGSKKMKGELLSSSQTQWLEDREADLGNKCTWPIKSSCFIRLLLFVVTITLLENPWSLGVIDSVLTQFKFKTENTKYRQKVHNQFLENTSNI